MTSVKRSPLSLLAGWVVLAVLATVLVHADEGYDPLRQISSQIANPNVLLVLDRSGSLNFNVAESSADDWNDYSGGTPSTQVHSNWRFGYGWANISADYSVSYTTTTSNGANGVYTANSRPFYPTSGVGHGYWIKGGYPINGYVKSGSSYVYTSLTGLALSTQITISGLAGQNGTYYVNSTPAAGTGTDAGYYYFRISSTKGGTSITINSSTTPDSVNYLNAYTSTAPSTYWWWWVPPSRMTVIKNALGNSVITYGPSGSATGTDPTGKSYYAYPTSGGPVTGEYYDWTASTKAWHNGWTTAKAAAPVPDPAYTATYLSSDLIGSNSGQVNWGLLIFSASLTNNYTSIFTVNPDSTQQANTVAALELEMSVISTSGTVNGTTYSGLAPYGGTPTSAGLDAAKTSLNTTYTADTQKSCNRLYATILVTDGESNTCNPSGNDWPTNSANCNGLSSSSSSTVWDSYPPGRTDELFLKTADTSSTCKTSTVTSVPVQSFIIGVSSDVAQCELNLDAYFGRTDATRTDAGVAWNKDTTRLPQNTSGTTSLSNYNPSGGNYAFFPDLTNPTALVGIFSAIIAGMGAGNYTTSSPSVSGSSPTTSGNVALLASAEFPGWKGHLYAYDLTQCDMTACTLTPATCDACTGTTANPVAAPALQIWDAGAVLAAATVGTNHTNGRSIYTWNPSNSNALVEIVGGTKTTDSTITSTVTTLNSICGSCGVTPQIVDFIRGNDGTISTTAAGTKRSWLLGSSINSTPAVIGAPALWMQGTLSNHSTFEYNYGTRHPIAWMGSDDGMLHGFDIVDGAEIIALLPPEMIANQVLFFSNYDPVKAVTGQPSATVIHKYGIAGSPRFGDVNVGTNTSPDYRTVIFLNEGPGHDWTSLNNANAITALDVTHPYPGRTVNSIAYAVDTNYSASAPVGVLWRYARTNALSWSTPAVGANGQAAWLMGMGSGFNPSSTAASSVAPTLLNFNAATGATGTADTLTKPTGTTLIGDQAFADCVVWQRGARFKEDNVVNYIVQADLNGQLWMKPFNTTGSAGSAAATISVANIQQPVYYSPAVSGYTGGTGTKYALYAFGSGSFYEKNSAVSGANIGTTGNFIPKVFLYVQTLDASGNVTATNSVSYAVHSIPTTYGGTTYMSTRAEVISSPLLVLPGVGDSSTLPIAIFLIYDPGSGVCAGTSYIVELPFDPSAVASTSISTAKISVAGTGAAGGIAIGQAPTGSGGATQIQFYIAQSGVGQNAKPSLPRAQSKVTPGSPIVTPNWWLELK